MTQTLRQAVILAGGQGTRLHPLTLTTPKPLIPINKKPFLAYLIEQLKNNGIEEIIILVGYLGHKIENYFGDGKNLGIKIKYSYSPVKYGTGARIREAYPLLDNYFLLLYGDNFWPLDLKNLMKFYKKMGTDALVTTYINSDGYTKNNMLVNKKGIVKKYDKTKQEDNLNCVDIGYFILQKNTVKNLPKYNFNFEKIIIPKLIQRKQLAGFTTHHKYYGLSNPARIPIIKKYLKPKKIIILDRDGVINKKPKKAEYITSWKEFELLPQVTDALKQLTKNGYSLFVITNQAGIARGIMTEKDLLKIHKKFLSLCKKNDIKIKGIYYCPHGWDDGCFCRKPQPGMLYKAAADHHFDLTQAIFIGDDERDIQAGKSTGCRTILIKPSENLYDIVKTHLLND